MKEKKNEIQRRARNKREKEKTDKRKKKEILRGTNTRKPLRRCVLFTLNRSFCFLPVEEQGKTKEGKTKYPNPEAR